MGPSYGCPICRERKKGKQKKQHFPTNGARLSAEPSQPLLYYQMHLCYRNLHLYENSYMKILCSELGTKILTID